jgi:hypothetical protein
VVLVANTRAGVSRSSPRSDQPRQRNPDKLRHRGAQVVTIVDLDMVVDHESS